MYNRAVPRGKKCAVCLLRCIDVKARRRTNLNHAADRYVSDSRITHVSLGKQMFNLNGTRLSRVCVSPLECFEVQVTRAQLERSEAFEVSNLQPSLNVTLGREEGWRKNKLRDLQWKRLVLAAD
ncbi:hypothetical protein EYF80_046589 [Liparis tanakae]|uniref:Uncharacterized protein n=1 Tax=Liparis tanakae TaxID=230148 RepID=A0A4Z2FQF1_9TELE|nr:hypothetical protein EYF80_046589 [Liparis tanakae]